MSKRQPIITSAGPHHRQFTTSAVAVQAIIVNKTEQVLLLLSPTRNQGWQVISGAFEAEESLLAGTLREVYEEAGPNIQVRPLGTVHAQTFHYDENVPYMVSTYYLFAYQGGPVQPGDDMIGSEFRWWSIPELETEPIEFHASTKLWLLKRAIDLFRLWRDQPDLPLQPIL